MKLTFAVASSLAVAASQQTPTEILTEKMTACTMSSGLVNLMQLPVCQEFINVQALGGGTLSNEMIEGMCKSACFPRLKPVYAALGICMETAIMDAAAAAPESEKATYEAMAEGMTGILGQQLEFFCTKNEASGDFCLKSVQAMSTDLTAAAGENGATTLATMCPAFQEQGCCFTSLYESMGTGILGSGTTMTDSIKTACGWSSIPPACAAPGIQVTVLQGSINFANLKETFYKELTVEKKRIVKNALSDDLARKAQVNPAQITVGSVDDDGKGGVQVSFTVSMAEGEDATEVSASIDEGLADTTAWGKLEAEIPAEGKTGELTASGAAVATKTITGSGNTDVGNDISSAGFLEPTLLSLLASAAALAL
jgi:hypothetical protein